VIVTTIKIPIWLWAAVILDLRQRGAGVRESGAFLLGRDDRDPARVTSYICYDDVDPERISRAPSPSTPPAAPALWRHCKAMQLDLLLDVHTPAAT
jgi:hypothetical protein